jgi:hypothetical protein
MVTQPMLHHPSIISEQSQIYQRSHSLYAVVITKYTYTQPPAAEQSTEQPPLARSVHIILQWRIQNQMPKL